MEQVKNSPKDYFNKENVLICWNAGNTETSFSYSDKLVEDGFKVVTSYSEFIEEFDQSTTKKDLKKNIKRSERKKEPAIEKISGLVVLCELTWGRSYKNQINLSPLHSMSGIEFVMEQRRNSCSLPVVFVSFLNREQQLNLSPRNEIISTPILGHFYHQLPSEPLQWIDILNLSCKRELSEIELEDVKSHFCDTEGMLRELNHDLLKYLDSTKPKNERDKQFEYVFKKIRDIVGSASEQVIEEIRLANHDTDKKYEEKIKRISASVEEFIKAIKTESQPIINHTSNYKVIILDDELNIDPRLKKLIEIMRQNGFIVGQDTDPVEAFKKVKKDEDNLIDLIISDHRIWNQSVVPKLMNQTQGYTFLQDCAGLNRTYTYVVFSALDRNFLMTQFGLRTKTLYKNGVLANESSMLNFIQNLSDWGKTNQNSIAVKFSSNKVFAQCYNWFRSHNDKITIEKGINDRIKDILLQFDNKVLSHMPNSCTYLKQQKNCSECNLFRTISANSFHLPTIGGYSTNYNNGRDFWDSANDSCVESFIMKFAARRLLFYFQFNLISAPGNCFLSKEIAEHLVKNGNYFNYRRKSGLDLAKNLWITKDFKKTPEEIKFLKSPSHIYL